MDRKVEGSKNGKIPLNLNLNKVICICNNIEISVEV